MRFIRGFGRFWYDFLIGDDWKIVFAVLVVLLTGTALVRAGGYDDSVLTVVLALGLGAAFTLALLVDVRRSRR